MVTDAAVAASKTVISSSSSAFRFNSNTNASSGVTGAEGVTVMDVTAPPVLQWIHSVKLPELVAGSHTQLLQRSAGVYEALARTGTLTTAHLQQVGDFYHSM